MQTRQIPQVFVALLILTVSCVPPNDVKSNRATTGLPEFPGYLSQNKRYEAEDALSPGKGTQASKIGQLVEDKAASGGKLLRFATTSPAPEGYVVMWGPYETLAPGDYVAIFRLRISDNNFVANLASLEVTSETLQQTAPQVIARLDLTGKSFPESERFFFFPLAFKLDQQARVELRILWYTKADLDVDYRALATPLP